VTSETAVKEKWREVVVLEGFGHVNELVHVCSKINGKMSLITA
jgi:hypothetical protein